MPELPEVQTVVTGLLTRLLGQVIDGIHLRRPDVLHPHDAPLIPMMKSRNIAGIRRRGKKIIFTLDDGNCFVIHLGMSGQITFEPRHQPIPPHTHFMLEFGNLQMRFIDPRRFGGVWWLGKTISPDEGMGPEPLGLRSKVLAQRLARTTRVIKSALLDQSLIAGLGNIYVDESLFLAGIHPLSRACDLKQTQVVILNRAIQLTLRQAIRAKGSSVRTYRDSEGRTGDFQKRLRVYDRAGQPCCKCRSPIVRIIIGGRSTHFCPRCQPENKVSKKRGVDAKMPAKG